MTCRNNRGFSLVDVLIAVAVMALLISPIVVQTFTAIDTNQKSKEKQVVIDNADMVMEYFKSTSLKNLVVGNGTGNITITAAPSAPDSVTCKLYDEDGNEFTIIGSSPAKKEFVYSAYSYTLEPVRLGREDAVDKSNETSEQQSVSGNGNIYSRKVILDDLNNQALENKCVIKYYPSYSDGKAKVDTLNSGITDDSDKWELTSEYSIVKYDSQQRVIAAVVEPHNYAYSNPNSFGIGNIQDLDSTKMAIIQGSATSLDSQFYDDFIGSLAAIVNANKIDLQNKGNWSAYSTTDGIKDKFEEVRENESTFSRSIVISVKAKTVEDDKAKSYNVKVTSTYRVSHSFLKQYNGGNNYLYTRTYTLFDQDFNTSESPDVFFAYEPFIINAGADYNSYAFNDYIIIDTDKYTSCKNPSKLYLVKPNVTWSQSNDKDTFINKTDGKDDEGNWDFSKLKANNPNYNYYFTKDFGYSGEGEEETSYDYSPVKIYLSYVNHNDGNKPLQIVSNIATTYDSATGETIINKALASGTQFHLSGGSSNGDFPGLTVGSTDSLDDYLTSIDDYNGSGKSEKSLVPPLDEASTSDGRLFSITVSFHNDTRPSESGVYTYFTGAKGAD
ncbi:hypothetical protein SAMN02910369_01343 [Lachnospiraceae bacterium NE2001]|nr:hypothetical protein SAMN02910369_01343 [Lachnospiraceae bacterium NE2001]